MERNENPYELDGWYDNYDWSKIRQRAKEEKTKDNPNPTAMSVLCPHGKMMPIIQDSVVYEGDSTCNCSGYAPIEDAWNALDVPMEERGKQKPRREIRYD